MLLGSNSAKDVLIKTDQEKYELSLDKYRSCLTSTLALAVQKPIISQSYDDFIPYTEMLMKSDLNIVEVSVFNIDGTYLANINKGNTTKNGQKASSDLLQILNTTENLSKNKTADNKYSDYLAPVKIGRSKFGTVLIRFESISPK